MPNLTLMGPYSDLVEAAQRELPLFPLAAPGADTQRRVREVLGFCHQPAAPRALQIDGRWVDDDLEGALLSWSVGYGPRTQALLLKPRAARGPLPGVLALHDHGGFKFLGKDKIADGPVAAPQIVRQFRDTYYGGRAYANALARAGFAVLVHDTFLWGSRRWPLEAMPAQMQELARAHVPPAGADPIAAQALAYNAAAGQHEHVASKFCNLLGTSMAGLVAFEDRVALEVLRASDGVDAARTGCIGLSGGGNRAALLTATHDHVAATVIVGLMATYASLLDAHINHTWMLYPFGLARHMDWPDLAACRAPQPLLVQYDEQDELFTPQGMRDAHTRIAGHFAGAGRPDRYTGSFYPGPHKFDLAMQAEAFAWLRDQLGA